jgi:amino acid adenylation domain-containing protein
MHTKELLSYLEKQDAKLWVKENGKLGYSAPKGVLTKTLLQNLAAHKLEIIASIKNKGNAYVSIPLVSRKKNPDLSFSQKRLWFLDKLEGKTHTYNILLCLKAIGNLNLWALEKALNQIIRRHEVLRTVFKASEEDSEPFQVILPELNVKVQLADMTGISKKMRDEKLRNNACEEAVRPFDLSEGPLIRLSIFRSEEEEHILLFAIHHIVFDVWSINIFFKELSIFYKEVISGLPSVLPMPEIQYADFSQWQKNRLEGEAGEMHLAFWKKHLENAPPFTEIPTDRPRPLVQTFAGSRIYFEIDEEFSKRIKQLTIKNNTTLFMTLYAMFAIQLFKYTGKKDIVIGTPVTNRNHKQLESLIGFFLNTLALRFRQQDDLSFTDFLNHVKKNVLKAHHHQEFPFEKLVDELKIERSLSHNPLFQVMFVFQNLSYESVDLQGLSCTPFDFGFCVSMFDLTLHTMDKGDKIAGFFQYNTDLFNSDTINRMIGHFQMLIKGVIKNPSEKISHLQMLTQIEQHRILVAFNDTQVNYSKNKCIHHLFEEQVEKTPDAIALVFGKEHLTYRELNINANQIAHFLKNFGMEPGMLVGICAEPSAKMIAGLLGILKAGGIYVPLDPNYPEERLAFMIEDANLSVLLTQGSLRYKTKARVVCLDSNWDTVESLSTVNPATPLSQDDLAYLIYTSGSTGKPKGVLTEHGSLTHHIRHIVDIYQMNEDDNVFLFASPSFDVSLEQIFSALITGASLILRDDKQAWSVQTFAKKISEYIITVVDLPPSYFHQLLKSWQNVPPAFLKNQLRLIIIGGEKIQPATIRLWNNLADVSARLVNEYGPTEATITTTVFDLTHHAIKDIHQNLPIGKPIAGRKVYILDHELQAVPEGIPAELYIGGAALARGYLNCPELTAEKFIANPFEEAGSRMYKTGDLARWLPDGNIEFIGRTDQQVKIRGYRIELGEIETILSAHPSVKENAVLVKENKNGDKYIAAYIIVNEMETKNVSDYRDYLKKKLPDYMIPSVFVFIEAFPLTPNGKIDTKALPEPGRAKGAKTYVAPRNTMEMLLVKLWEDILDIFPVGISDDFFESGGHSLLAVKLVSAINKKFNANFPLAILFQSKTIESLANFLYQDSAMPKYTPLVPLQPRGEKRPLFCVHAAGGNVFRFVRLTSEMGIDRPIYGLQARGLESNEQPYSSIEEMANAYVEAIKCVQSEGPYILLGWSLGGTVAFEMAFILEKIGESVLAVIMIDAPSPFTDTVEENDIEFMLERLKPAANMTFKDLDKQNSKEAKLLYIFNEMKLSGLLSPYIAPEVAKRHLKLHKYHNKILCQYRPSDHISSNIIFFKPSEKIPFDTKMKNPLDWKTFTSGKMEIHKTSGNHFNMISGMHSLGLAKKLNRCIDEMEKKKENTIDNESV